MKLNHRIAPLCQCFARLIFTVGIVPAGILLTSVLGSAKPSRAETNARPNILYFYVDDMGWGSIGPNGQTARRDAGLPYVKTPNIDQLARQGINFTRGYGCHVCSPARSSQQSGFHQGHTFADRNDPNNAKKAMRADEVLMGDALSDAGYVTGYWGKWGYGGSKSQIDPVIENVQTLPTSHGYQHVLAELHHVRAHTFFQPTLWHAPASESVGGLKLISNSVSQIDSVAYPDAPAYQSDPEYPKIAYCDDSYSAAAYQFVLEQSQRYNVDQTPFFALLAAQIPHAPFDEVTSLPNWDIAYRDEPWFDSLDKQTQQWAAMVTRIDAHIGNILAALEDPNRDGDKSDSVTANTLIVFQSDNGGPNGKNLRQMDSNGGLSGVKGSIQEGGIRVPLVMRWPAAITDSSDLRSGTSLDRVVDVTDLLPTFCELAATEIPLGVDGVSIAPTLTGHGRQLHRDFIIHEAGNGQSIIRDDYKYVISRKGPDRLFNLQEDPAETDNIISKHPELAAELKELLIGERVMEPRGFATTYHSLLPSETQTSEPTDLSKSDSWSDYVYENDGVTYLTDAGDPKLSWIATIQNQSNSNAVASVTSDLEVLALEVGTTNGFAPQTLSLGPDSTVHGRNEIRLRNGAICELNSGTLSSLRWTWVGQGSTLVGPGQIDGMLRNDGNIDLSADQSESLVVDGDYSQSRTATLLIGQVDQPKIQITGAAHIDGTLDLSEVKRSSLDSTDDFVIIKARQITGEFNKVRLPDSPTDYRIKYTVDRVVLAPKPD